MVRRKLGFFVCLLLLLGGVWAQTPQVTYALDDEELINDSFCFTSNFENTGATGFGPYLRIILEPGFTLDSVETFESGTNEPVGTFPAGGELTDPITGTPVTGTPGGQFVIHRLPVGTVVAGGPDIETTVCVTNTALSPSQNDNPNVDQTFTNVDAVTLQPAYEFGDTATGVNGPIVGAAESDSLDLVEAIYTFNEFARESEGSPGSQYVETYQLNIDIADGRQIVPVYTYDIPSDEVPDDGSLSISGAAGCSVSITPGGGAPNGVFELDCTGNSVTGSAAPDDINISFDYYIRSSTLDTSICPTGGNTSASAKHLTIAKEVSPALTVPGTVLTFTIDFEISDDTGLSALTLQDTLPDGLDFDENSVNLVFDQVNGALSNGSDFTFSVSGGVTTVTYDLRAVNGRDFPAGIQGQLTYQATVLQNYAATGVHAGSPILADDTLGSAEIEGTYSTTGGATSCSEDSNTIINIVPVTGEKSISRINGATVSGPTYEVAPGDTVYYRLRLDVPSGATSDVIFEDFFPLPVFDVTTINPATDITLADATATPPGPDNVGATPVNITTNAAQNSLRFELGDVAFTSSRTLSYDVAIDVAAEPFADGLILSNLFQYATSDTTNSVINGVEPIAITIRQPELTIDKKAISVSGDAALSGENVTGADAGDVITYTLSIENIGGADAYGVTITDDAPAQGYGTCSVNSVQLSGGADVSSRFAGTVTGNSSDLFGAGLTLDTGEVIAAGETIVVTYACTLPQSLEPEDSLTNTAKITEYYGTASAVGDSDKDIVANVSDYGSYEDSTTLATRAGSVAKTLVSSSEAGTTGSNVTVGETVTYSIVATFPEGTIDNAQIIDTLQQNANGNLEIVSAEITQIGADLNWTGKPAVLPSAITTGATGFTLSLGTVTNTGSLDTAADADDRITIEVTALVTNDTPANTQGKTPTNTGRLRYERADGSTATKNSSVNVTVVEPALQVTKSASATTADALDTITFTLRVSHTGTSNAAAFDLSLTDVIPAGFTYAGSLQNTGAATVNATSLDDNGGAGPVTVTYDSLPQGDIAEVSFDVTVDTNVTPEQVITNTAELDYYSVGDELNTERRLYEASGNRQITISAVQRLKSIVTTSLNADTSSDVVIGEVITYEIVTTLPEGEIENLTITDADLDPTESLTLLDGTVISIGGNTTAGARQGGNLSALPGGDLPAAVAVNSVTTAAANAVSFDFGDVKNTADGAETDADRIVVRVRAIVSDDVSNTAGDTLTNTATITYGPGGSEVNRTATADVTIKEPDLSFTKNATSVVGAGTVTAGNVTGADAGDVITYEITISHDGTAAANTDTPAYNLSLTDTLPNAPATTYNNDASFSANCQAPTSAANGATAGTIDFSVARLDPATTCTITYSVTLNADVAPSATGNNSASLSYASSPGSTDETPRTYTETNQNSSVTTASPVITKVINTTSVNADASSVVAVGEVVTYYLSITLPEGETTNVQIVDSEADADGVITLLSGEVIAIGGQLSSSSPLAVSDTVAASGGTVTFDFGTVTNSTTGATGNATAEDQIVVAVTAVIADDASNAAGDVLTNTATLNYGTGLSVTATTDVTIHEPTVTLTKTAVAVTGAGTLNAGNVINADAGDEITYQLLLTHTGTAVANSNTPAFNLNLTDTLPVDPGTTFINGSATFSAGCQAPTSGVDGVSAGTIDFSVARLDPATTCTISYRVTVNNDAAPATTDNNTVTLEFDSVSGATADETPRTNTGVPPATSSVSTAAPSISKVVSSTSIGADASTDVAVGEVITYTLSVTLPEGITRDVQIVDDETDADGTLTILDGTVISIGGVTTAGVSAGGQLSGSALTVGTTVNAVANVLTMDFSDITNATAGAVDDGAEDQIVIAVRALVDPADASNTAATVLTNTATLNYGVAQSTSATADVTIKEPDLSFTKNAVSVTGAGSVDANGNVIAADVGDVITYEITVTHDGTAAANTDTPAFNILVSDNLPTDPTTSYVTTSSFSAGCTGATSTTNPGVSGDIDFSIERINVTESCTITYTVEITAATSGASDTNTASLSFDSVPGTTTDETPRTNTSVPDENSSITMAKPVIGVAKSLTTANAPAVAPNADGTFDLTYVMTVENLGDVALIAVQVEEDLAVSFPGMTVTATALSATGTLSANTVAGFNTTGELLVAASSTLPLAATETINLTLNVDPNNNLGAFSNQVTASATSPGGIPAPDDVSDDGVDPDADGDGLPNEQSTPYDANHDGTIDPNEGVVDDTPADGQGNDTTSDENDPTPVLFAENPVIGVAKDVTIEGVSFAGIYTLRYEYVVENLGNVNLSNVQLTDDLTKTFIDAPLPAGSSYTVIELTTEAIAPATTATLTPNTTGATINFDGDPDAGQDELLNASASTLPVGVSNKIILRLELDPADVNTPFINQATATAKGPNDTDTTDLSDEGSEPDADGDNNPNEDFTNAADPNADSPENNATVLNLVETPVIGVAKAFGSVIDNQDGSYVIPVSIVVRNYGNIDLVNVQVTDNLEQAFAGTLYSVSDLSASTGLSVNTGFTGNPADINGTNLLAGTDTLFVNSADGVTEGEIRFNVTIFPTTTSETYFNQAEATASSPGGITTSDVSDDGSDPDADGDGLPNEQSTPYDVNGDGSIDPNEGVVDDAPADGQGNDVTTDENDPSVVTFTEQRAALGVAKSISGPVTNNADGTYTFDYQLIIENLGGVELRNVSLTDDLNAVFGTALLSAQAIDGVTSAGLTGLSANPNYDGVADTEVLATFTPPDQNQELAVGQAGVVTLRVVIEPTTNLGPYLNSAVATGTSPGGQIATDISDEGSEPDADGDGLANEQTTPYDASNDGTIDPNEGVVEDTSGDGVGNDSTGDENDPTRVTFTEDPVIGIAKRFVDLSAVDPINQPGVFSLTLEFVIENLGDIEVRNVQLVDDLNAAFQVANGSTYQVTSLTAQNGLLTPVNPASLNSTSGNSNLLIGTDTLAVAAREVITLVVTVTPFDAGVDYENQASVTAVSPAGEVLSDLSDDGVDPDPDGDGNPGENNAACATDPDAANCEDDPTRFKFESPFIGVAKAATTINNGDGTYTVTYTFIIENLGDVTLDNLSLIDDLNAVFGATLISAQASNGLSAPGVKSLLANPDYDGVTDTQVLATGQELESDITNSGVTTTKGTVSVTALVRPVNNAGPYLNTATGAGTSPGGQTVNDISDDGTTPDSDGDGNANEIDDGSGDPANDSPENDPTPVTFTENPLVGVAKNAVVISNPDDSFDVTFTFTVENFGDVALTNLQLTDDLTTFYTNTDLSAQRITLVSSDLTYNSNYDGNIDTNLLAGTDTLLIGETKTLTITLESLRVTGSVALTNQAVVSGDSPAGVMVSDTSQDGLDADPDEDNDPLNNNNPTPVTLAENAVIGVAKAAAVTVAADGSFDVELTFTLENLGNTDLLGVQMTDDLAEFYANTTLTAAAIALSPSDAAELAFNPNFDGMSDLNLLTGADTLAVGETKTLILRLSSLSVTGATSLSNQVQAEGTSPNGQITTDTSDDGLDPDPDGDGNPDEDGENDPTPVLLNERPVIGVAKAATVVANEDGSFDVSFTFILENLGNTPLVNVQLTDTLSDYYANTDLSATNIRLSPDDSNQLSYNNSFDGATDSSVLTGVDTLAIAETKSVTVLLAGIRPTGVTSLTNSALASGQSPAGTVTEDTSHNGNDPDPDGDGNPDEAGENDPTPAELVQTPVIGVAKAATVNANADGSFDIDLTFVLENLGNVSLQAVQLTDSLADIYANTDLTAADITLSPLDSSELDYNAGFDGVTDLNVLSGTDTLAVGESKTITLRLVNVVPTGATSLTNSATASAESPSGIPTTDTSTNGLEPDPDGDGNPDEPGENTPTPVELTEAPVVGLAKTADVSLNADGSFDVTFTFTAENLGNTPLSNVQITDSLFFYYSKTDLRAEDIRFVSGELSYNSGFNGTPDANLLTGTDTLALAETKTIRIALQGLNLLDTFSTVANSAVITAQSPQGTSVNDVSDDGTNPDSNGNGNPSDPDENDPTVIQVNQTPLIGLAKAATVTNLGNGSFDVDFLFTVTNYGDVNLTNLQITDSLSAFYDATDLSAAKLSLSPADSGELSYNTAYNGATNTNLLTGADTLAVGETKTLTLRLNGITPNSNATALTNLAIASGQSPNGTTVSDESTDGTNPDPDNNGPQDNNTPTPVTFTDTLALLIEKTVQDGTFTYGDVVTYTLTVTNPNPEAVTITITDTPASRLEYVVDSTVVTPEERTPLSGKEPIVVDATLQWAGIVLGAAGSTDVSDSVTITYDMRILPGAESPLMNNATAEGLGDSGRAVASADVSAEVALEESVFEQNSSQLIGRVYIDTNRDGRYNEGTDAPVANARVILTNGWQTTTDTQGNYAFRDVASDTPAESWTVLLDKDTAPYTPRPHPDAVGDGYLHRVRVQGLTVSDFPLEPATGLTRAKRTTTITYGPVTITKDLTYLPDATRVLIRVTSDEPFVGLLIKDLLPDGSIQEFRPDLTDGEAMITYDLPPDSPLTDPEVTREQQ